MEEFQSIWHVTDRQTDRQTTCRSTTALCNNIQHDLLTNSSLFSCYYYWDKSTSLFYSSIAGVFCLPSLSIAEILLFTARCTLVQSAVLRCLNVFLCFIWFFLVCAFVTWIKVNFTYLLTYSWTLCVGCGGQLRDVNGSFASPSYPGSVTTAFTCRWVIHVPARRNVNLRLNVYPRLSESGSSGGANTGCSSSYVQVWVDSSTQTIHQARLLGRYCTAVSLTLYGVDQKNGLRLMGLNRLKVCGCNDGCVSMKNVENADISLC